MEIRGVVQGVGFRPFVHALAWRESLAGHVRNAGGSVVVEVEGGRAQLDAFTAALSAEAPPLAQLESLQQATIAVVGETGFSIGASTQRAGDVFVPADAATCEACLGELADRTDRRHAHPFISCTDCGPRYTMVRGVPYDRARTTMAGFAMCSTCRAEYEDPRDRRFHAESIACHDCGPRLSMPIGDAADVLRDGGVLAVKGLGGYHLACLASDAVAVARLREKKRRVDKPFAIMTSAPERLVRLHPEEDALLRGPARPVVLAARRHDAPLAAAVAPLSAWIGVMLPYTPVHHLLLAATGEALVMTSANLSDEPIVIDDADARAHLAGIADAFLAHDRAIHRRCEDSVVRREHVIRRSRGMAPSSLRLPVAARRPLVAAGAELKSTFCVVVGDKAHLSPHLGDLEAVAARLAFRADLALYLDVLGVRPELVAHDLHEGYAATRWALEQEVELLGVQHHHAHAASCLAEHGRREPALAVVLDGSGWGPDGTFWGGEVLRCDLDGYERVAHLEAVPLPGGDAAIRQPWRSAAAYLERGGRPVPFARWPLVRQSLAINAPRSSGAGRLFDAAAALLGVREHVTYEGQAAIELEDLAGQVEADAYPCRMSGGVLRGADLIARVHDDLAEGRARREIAAAFHEGVAAAFAQAVTAAAEPDERSVLLTGGTMQNLRLRASLERRLAASGFEVLTHRTIPPNDGGISFGQAAIAARRTACA